MVTLLLPSYHLFVPPTIKEVWSLRRQRSCVNTQSGRTQRCVCVIFNKEGIPRVIRQGRLTIIGEETHWRALRQYKTRSVSEDWVGKGKQKGAQRTPSWLRGKMMQAYACSWRARELDLSEWEWCSQSPCNSAVLMREAQLQGGARTGLWLPELTMSYLPNSIAIPETV